MKLTLKLPTALLLAPLATLHAADKPKPAPNDAARTAATAELTYSRSKSALNAGVTFTVEYSDTFATNSWSASGVTETILTDDGTVQTVKASVPSDSTILRRYMHLKVTAP